MNHTIRGVSGASCISRWTGILARDLWERVLKLGSQITERRGAGLDWIQIGLSAHDTKAAMAKEHLKKRKVEHGR